MGTKSMNADRLGTPDRKSSVPCCYFGMENDMNFFEELKNYDPEVAAGCEAELRRQRNNIELIASENIVSRAVLLAAGGVLTNKYAEGYPGKRYYGGCQCVDVVEEIARKRACELFGAEHANVQPHCGASANLAVFFALLQPGDTVLGMAVTSRTARPSISRASISISCLTASIP